MDTLMKLSIVAIAISQLMMCGQVVDWPSRLSKYTLRGELCGDTGYDNDGTRIERNR